MSATGRPLRDMRFDDLKLAGEPPPSEVPCLLDPVPAGGRELYPWEYEELSEWFHKFGPARFWVMPIPGDLHRAQLFRVRVRQRPPGVQTRVVLTAPPGTRFTEQ